ncbi:MAG: helix-turn-helix domain-containing protein [Sporomusaceae bacterium]|nr:helix-turn-helix domain-containing protein [Sporomusaceae bacterium]
MEDIRNLILDKAKERFDRFGYRKTTMDELSRDCKVSKRTIYELFRDKEDLFTNLMIRENQAFQKVLFEQIAIIDDPLEQITQLIRTAIRFFNEDHFLTRLLKADDQLFSAFISKKYNTMVREEVISLISDIL